MEPTINSETLALCFGVARQYGNRNRFACDDWRELVSGAYVGLMESVKAFDPSRNKKGFRYFAVIRMRQRIVDYLRYNGPVRRPRQDGPTRPKVYFEWSDVNETCWSQEPPASDEAPGVDVEQADYAERFWSVVRDSVPPRTAVIFALHYIHRWKLWEIAERFGVTESRISQVMQQARPMLREGIRGAGLAPVA